MTKRSLPFVLLLASIAAAGCMRQEGGSSQAQDKDADVFKTDSAGRTVVHSGTPRGTEHQGWTVFPDPELVIGVLTGPESYQFVDIADAARLSDGRIVVVDRGARTVRLFRSDGEFRETIGGPGAGPGEFIDPVSVLVTAGDTIVIWDQGQLRVTRFGPLGELTGVRTVDLGRLANGMGPGMPSDGEWAGGKNPGNGKRSGSLSGLFPGLMEPMGDGTLLVRLVEKTGATPPPGFHRPRSGAIRISEEGSVMDTLMLFGDTEQVRVHAPWGPFSVTPPGAKQTVIAHSGPSGKTCIGDQEAAEILCFEANGKRTSVRWEGPPVALNEEDIARWREATVEVLAPKLSRKQVLDLLSQVQVPEFRPPYSRILLDPAGSLWAERGPTPGAREGWNDFLVFDPEGALLTVVSLPPIRVLEIGSDHVLGIYEDELEVQYVRLYALRRPPNGAGTH